MTRWESIVSAAREDFQQHLAGSKVVVEARPIQRAYVGAAADSDELGAVVRWAMDR